ncbi:MAG: amidohydrolase, partial [Gemmatimonadales bacterium]
MTRRALAALAAGALAACAIERHPVPAADLVFRHGAVYTLDAERSWAQAVAVRGGRIVYVGNEDGIAPYIGTGTEVVDLAGRMVLPGFHDSHAHPLSGGLTLADCDLSDSTTRAGVVAVIRWCAAAHPDRPWLRGRGWALPIFPDANPRKELLDNLVPDRPAYLRAADGHSAWANSRALALAGITKETPDPPDGRIERDSRTGEPSGTLREGATDLVSRLLPERTAAERETALKLGLRLANRDGITSLYDASVDTSDLLTYQAIIAEDSLTVRVVAALEVDPAAGPGEVPGLERLRERFRLPRLRPVAAKIFADGVLESGTAALLDPYLRRHGDRGHSNYTPAALDSIAVALDRAGFQIHVHAIGDRAVRMTLDALAAAREANGPRDARPMMAHIELIEPEDIPRFRELGVIADFQPLWAYADDYITELTEPQLGAVRSRWLYPIGSVARSGAVIVGGSDWPVSSLNPLDAIQVAITRRAPDAPAGPAWIPQEIVDLPTILAAYTINGAYAFGQEAETGSLEAGKAADLVVLDRNLFEIPAEQIHQVRVVRTVLEGKT